MKHGTVVVFAGGEMAAPAVPMPEADYVIAAGYKWLLGPYSLGYLWAAPEHRDGTPLEFDGAEIPIPGRLRKPALPASNSESGKPAR